MMKRKAGHFDFLFGEKRGGKIARVTFIPATKVPMSNGVFSEDPPALDGVLPIRPLQNQQTNQQSEDATGFDQNYIPLDGEIRRARKGLLWQWAQTQDAFIAEVLRRQEGIEIPYQEMLAGVFGKKCGWREAMIIEARHDENCRNELGQWLSLCAMKGESKELDAFSQAVESVSRAEEVGPVNRKFVCGLMFVLRCEHETRCRPPQNKVREFLKKNGMPVDDSRKNEARDLFKGPIMGTLPKGKAGRPRCPRG
jgi:hypothetical protein